MLNHLIDFIGRTHLVVLHFPIALVIVAALVELSRALIPRLTRRAYRQPFRPGPTATILLALALLTTAHTVTSGLILGFSEPPKVDLHRILGIVSAVLVLLTVIALLLARVAPTRAAPQFYLVLLVLSAGAVGFTGHLGGNLTHGTGFLTRPLMEMFTPTPTVAPVTDPLSLGINQASLDFFDTMIQPIFTDSCIKCHGPDKSKGDIRLDNLAFVLDKNAEILVRGDPDASEIMYRIELPHDDEDAMPPQDEGDPLTGDQIEAIRGWIESLGDE